MRTRFAGGVLSIGLLVAVLAGCSDDKGDAKAADTTSSTVGSTTTTGGTSTTADAENGGETNGDVLLDGRHFGYITTLVAGHDEISGQFDLAKLLTGDEAAQAQQAAGVEEPLDYYITNVNPKERPIVVDPEATVLDVDYDHCCEPTSTDPASWVADREARDETRTAAYITIKDGVVTKIEEQYLP
jgi:hypothetical protein